MCRRVASRHTISIIKLLLRHLLIIRHIAYLHGIYSWLTADRTTTFALHFLTSSECRLRALNMSMMHTASLVKLSETLGPSHGVYLQEMDSAWLGMMVRRKKLGEREVRAAREIQRAILLGREACANVPAIDFTKLRVDGGRPAPVERFGAAVMDEVSRYAAWVAAVQALDPMHQTVKGTKGAATIIHLVEDVLVRGRGPRMIDNDLGVRNGRVGEVIARELKRYTALNFLTF